MKRTLTKKIKRVVIKVGSSVISNYQLKPKEAHFKKIINQIGELRKKNIDVILVSSGSIVFGMGEFKKQKRENDLAFLQTMSSVGQTILMNQYRDILKENRLYCGQILLTWDDFQDRKRFNNIRRTIQKMFDLKIIPIINENDTISTEEIKFGDNDKLSAMIASLIQADILIILSDVEGFYDCVVKKKVITEIKEITKEIEEMAGGTEQKHISKGGMITKLEAVKIVTAANIPCVIANGEREDVIKDIIRGENVGTLFVEKSEKILARKHWIAFGAKSQGTIIIDKGAEKALLKRGNSLLYPGIIKSEGIFKKDDIVIIVNQGLQEIGKGKIRYSKKELDDFKERQSNIIIHYNDLILKES